MGLGPSARALDFFKMLSKINSGAAGPNYEDHDIAARLPELREVLALLRKQWEQEEAIGGKKRRGPGNVFLVGTGPGDPDLLTVKALKLMQSAELVLYDRLVSTDILELVHAGARLLYVGKTSGYHSRTQVQNLLFSISSQDFSFSSLMGLGFLGLVVFAVLLSNALHNNLF